MTTANEVATGADYNVEGLEELGQVWAEAAQSDPSFRPILPQLKVPAGGGTIWEDKDDASFAPRRELEVVILHSQVTTQLYLTKYEDSDDSSRRPDAWSDDGISQVVPPETYAKVEALNAANGWALPFPSTDLSECPYNKWVGDAGAAILPGQTSGKATAEYHEIYAVVRGSAEPVPFKVRVSPASIKQWAGGKGYKNILQSRGVRLHTVETILTLQAMKSGNVEYSEIHFRRGRNLEPALRQKMGELAAGIRESVQGRMFSINGAAPQAIAAPVPVAALPAPVVEAPVAAAVTPAVAALDQAYAEAVAAAPMPATPPAPVAAPAMPAPVAAPIPAPVAVDPGVANVANSFGATAVAPAPVAAAPAPAAPAVPAPAPQVAAPAAPPAPAVAQPAPVAVAVGSGVATGDDIDF